MADVYPDDRLMSERRNADRAPRERCAAPERTPKHVFSPAAIRGRVTRRQEEEGRSLHLPWDDSASK